MTISIDYKNKLIMENNKHIYTQANNNTKLLARAS